MTMAGKMTMKQYQKSAADRRNDASGKTGRDGSKKDRSADRTALSKINARRKGK